MLGQSLIKEAFGKFELWHVLDRWDRAKWGWRMLWVMHEAYLFGISCVLSWVRVSLGKSLYPPDLGGVRVHGCRQFVKVKQHFCAWGLEGRDSCQASVNPRPSCRKSFSTRGVKPRHVKFGKCRFGFACLRWLLLVCWSIRIGEAAVPGPQKVQSNASSCWTIGVANPSGLNGKAHLIGQEADVWCMSETHLSAQGFRAFRSSLRCNGSPFTSVVQGCPVPPRSTASDVGNWSGVAVLSQHPVRSLPHAWEQAVVQTSRIMIVSLFCKGIWVHGAVIYGTPTGPTHPGAKRTTSALLTLALQRLDSLSGPRFIAGDVNHDLTSLECYETLEAMSFRDAQDVHFENFGIPPRATCKHKTRRDYLLMSPEMQNLFERCDILDDVWPDHSPIIARFKGGPSDLVRYPWPVPDPINWKQFPSRVASDPLNFVTSTDCDDTYRVWWKSIENEVRRCSDRQSRPPASCFGRGQLVAPRKFVGTHKPVCVGRGGDFEPKFLGVNWHHAQMVKQVRRIQSLARLRGSVNTTVHHQIHCVQLWQSVLEAKGFRPSFRDWWKDLSLRVGEPLQVPSLPPSQSIAWLIYQVVTRELEVFERHLAKHRSFSLKLANKDGMQRVFNGVRRDMPVQVETLLQTQQSRIVDIDRNESAVVVDPPCSWVDRVPVTCQGVTQQPIFVEADKIWLEDITRCQIGDPIVQKRAVGKLEDIFQAFVQQWTARWGRHANIPVSQWADILAFVETRFPRLEFQPHAASPMAIRACAQTKKRKAATGLDGVSRQDVLNLDESHLQTLSSLYQRAELDGIWPTQTIVGAVRSLAKVVSPQDVVDFRPVTVFSMVYRIWSSIQSRWFLTALDPHMDSMMFGNRAGHQASQLWRYVLDRVEHSQLDESPICGLVVDLSKAFNTLPRVPTMAMASRLGLPFSLLKAWSGMLGSMQRRFVVRSSYSQAVFSTCGFPEGCGLSCLAMMIIDNAFAMWIRALGTDVIPLTFVDNWEIITTASSQITLASNSVMQFARLLDLTVDAQKTFTWGSTRGVRTELKAAGHRVVSDGLDLGAHLVYTRQIRNAALVKRLQSLEDFWEKLRVVRGSHNHKSRAIRAVGWTRGLHGISAVLLGSKHWVKLRTQVMRALGLEKPNASPWLQLAIEPDGTDPQHFAILSTIRDFRAFGSNPVQLLSLDRIGDGLTVHASGSINAVLCHRLHQLGWGVGSDGMVRDQFGEFHLPTANILEVDLRVQFAWQNVVCQHVSACRV